VSLAGGPRLGAHDRFRDIPEDHQVIFDPAGRRSNTGQSAVSHSRRGLSKAIPCDCDGHGFLLLRKKGHGASSIRHKSGQL